MSDEASGGVTKSRSALYESVGLGEKDDAAGVPFCRLGPSHAVTVSAGSSTVFTAEYAAGITSDRRFMTSSIVIAK